MIIYFCAMRLQDENKKEAIFEASIKLVNEIGFVSASVAKIAKEAGVSPATLYIYHKNKEELLVAIYVELKRRLSEAILDGYDKNLEIKETMRGIWYKSFDFAEKHPDYMMFTEQFSNSPFSEKVDKEKVNKYFAPFLELFQKGIKEKILKDVPIEILGIFGFYPILILTNKKLCNVFSTNDDLSAISFEMAWDAISV